MAREINLVPDIKNDMIKALKMRNYILFCSIVVAAVSVSATLLTAFIMLGQQAALDSKAKTIDNLSTKMNSYNDLKDFLTIRDQISDIDDLTNNKKVLSRTFNILGSLIPTGADTITISELNVDLSTETPTFNFDAQANAGQEPYIDYNVLDAFKKSLKYMRYDYGDYVDKNGDKIPAYCMIESGSDGSVFNDEGAGGRYAFWTIKADGCEPASSNSNSDNEDSTAPSTDVTAGYQTESYNGQDVVRIWRTPQFGQWYKSRPSNDSSSNSQPSMTLDGTITGVEHFESRCTTYTGHEDSNYVASSDETIVSKVNGITWVSQNTSCKLVPAEEEGILIYDHSNGRGEDGELVLRFSSTISFDPQVFDFKNAHMITLPPSGRRNVTDSYVQIQAMFGERAADCEQGDTSCTENKTNSGGDNLNDTNPNDSGSTNINTPERNQNG